MSGSGPRILIAEDDPSIASVLVDGLSASGFITTVARDGKAALERAESGQFDLLVLDLVMPEMDGFAVLGELRARANHLPVIILTALDSTAETVAGLEGGADDYIVKPFEFAELLARIRARLRDNGDKHSA